MNKPFKVLFIFPLPQIWGGEVVWLNSLKFIDREKFEPVVLTFGEGELEKSFKSLGIEYHIFKKTRLRNIISSLKTFFKLIVFMKKGDFAAINSLGVNLLSFCASSILRIPFCFHIHTIHALPWLDRWCLKNASYIVTASSYSKNFLAGYGIDEKRIDVIPNGLDFDRIIQAGNHSQIKNELNLRDAILVCYTGRIVPWKNLEVLIKVIPDIKKKFSHPIKFIFVGNTPEYENSVRDYQNSLIRLADKLDCRNDVFFLGRRQDVLQILGACDIFVIPSLLEVCSMSILEAMALGKPVVAMNAGGNPEIITHATGVLVCSDDAKGLSDAIVELARDKNKRIELGNAAKKRVAQNFSFDENSRRFGFLQKKLCLTLNNLKFTIRDELFPDAKSLNFKVVKRPLGTKFMVVTTKDADNKKSEFWVKVNYHFFEDIEQARKLSEVKFKLMVELHHGFRKEEIFDVVKPHAYIHGYAATVTENCRGKNLKSWMLRHCLVFNPFFNRYEETVLSYCGQMLAKFQKISEPYKDLFTNTTFSDKRGIYFDLERLVETGIDCSELKRIKNYLFHNIDYVKKHCTKIVVAHPDFGPSNLLIDEKGKLTLLDFDGMQSRTALEDVAMFLVRLDFLLRYPFVDRKRIKKLKEAFLKGYQEFNGFNVDKQCLEFWQIRYLVASLAGEIFFLKRKNHLYRSFVLRSSKNIVCRWIRERIYEV